FIMLPPTTSSTLFPYTTLFRSGGDRALAVKKIHQRRLIEGDTDTHAQKPTLEGGFDAFEQLVGVPAALSRDDHAVGGTRVGQGADRKSTRLNSSHVAISYAVFC